MSTKNIDNIEIWQNNSNRKIKMSSNNTVETKTIKIDKTGGLHLRVASEVVKICQRYKSKVYISCRNCPEAEGCSVLSILMLSAGKGENLTIRAEGVDAKEVVESISGYFTDGAGI
jgi:phosphocarrier protein